MLGQPKQANPQAPNVHGVGVALVAHALDDLRQPLVVARQVLQVRHQRVGVVVYLWMTILGRWRRSEDAVRSVRPGANTPTRNRHLRRTDLVLPGEDEALVGVVHEAAPHQHVEVEEQLVRRRPQQGQRLGPGVVVVCVFGCESISAGWEEFVSRL